MCLFDVVGGENEAIMITSAVFYDPVDVQSDGPIHGRGCCVVYNFTKWCAKLQDFGIQAVVVLNFRWENTQQQVTQGRLPKVRGQGQQLTDTRSEGSTFPCLQDGCIRTETVERETEERKRGNEREGNRERESEIIGVDIYTCVITMLFGIITQITCVIALVSW
jgi:hypothetical protein